MHLTPWVLNHCGQIATGTGPRVTKQRCIFSNNSGFEINVALCNGLFVWYTLRVAKGNNAHPTTTTNNVRSQRCTHNLLSWMLREARTSCHHACCNLRNDIPHHVCNAVFRHVADLGIELLIEVTQAPVAKAPPSGDVAARRRLHRQRAMLAEVAEY